ncbi:serine/threonine-protein kinase M1 [Linderina macrospora]|uniref:Serine/threonine-protein kinase M1 n=1 Tax=Linderina macrospora TaxID=4868 RepID=A0ACC1J9R0_9FUNG|nr:serine/threonine-protein kinase M1 [Linderina macrospora]
MHIPKDFPDLAGCNGFADKVTVMDSMQKPKRIEILGSDGCSYPFLCKSKDDLRKDACVMRLNTMINHLMQANRQTRERNLHIRTYAVVPLNEECGLIQWVGSTTGIRSILMNQFKKRNVKIHVNDIKRILAKTSPSPQEIFTKELLPKYPSVMHEWFMESFPNPGEWLLNRTAFTRTAAVMSMIGYIIGLGDRHCVNILLDEKTGDVVHVDFDCLFNQGLLQEKPEVVPFRLTRNMVDAMGVTGYEGTFRKTCEMTLRLLCEHRDALMSVLEPLVHDLLVEWIRRSYPGNMSLEPIRELASMNDHAKKILDTLRKKLQGKLHGETQLSVEEQVDELIREATDPGRLFQMFIGWAAYL